MNRPTEPTEILALPAVERDAYAAEVCLSEGERIKHTEAEFDDDCNFIARYSTYEPSQPTEKGKAQCWDLAEKYGIEIEFDDDCVYYRDYTQPNEEREYSWEIVIYKNLQAAVVTAAILCALAKKEK